MKKTLILCIIATLTMTCLFPAAGPSGRNIAVLAYGSVINNPGDMKINSSFKKTPFGMPIRLSRASRWPGFPNPSSMTDGRRFSLTIDPLATPEPVYYARSSFSSIPEARDDLAKREGSPNRSNIAYLRRLRPGQAPDAAETYRNNYWAGYLLQLEPKYADKITMWADQNNFDAVIWTSLPANVQTEPGAAGGRLIFEYLNNDPVLLKNTQAYIRGLPADIKTRLLKDIENFQPEVSSSTSSGASSSEPLLLPENIVDTTFMYAHRGNLPVLITAPHGGRVKIDGVSKRSSPSATFAWDHSTDRLTHAVSDELKNLTGVKPYIVVAKFHRDQIDGNRSSSDAYEDARAKPIYDAFQKQIDDYLVEMKQRYGDDIIHFDIHGQAKNRNIIYRGTRNRSLVSPLIEKKGEDAFTGPYSVLGQLEGKRYTIYPANNERSEREYGPFTGGYIVGHYGKKFGIPSIQLETGGWHRSADNIPLVGRDVAAAIVEFLNHYNYKIPNNF